MDIEKLIERLRTESLYKDKATLEIMDLCMEAADALSTLQAENEELKEKLYDGEGVNLVDYWMQQAKIEENGHRNCQAELEQARAEITRLKHYEDKCHDCPIVCAKREIIKAHEELEAVQNELEQKSKLIAQQAAELERRDKLLKEQETELDQMKRENETLKHALQNWHEEV